MTNNNTDPVRRALTLIIVTIVAISATAHARRSDTEREVLARAVHELGLIEQIITDAERRADSDARVFFDYDELREELSAVRAGIGEYMAGDRLQPREIAPLSADYTRHKSDE